MLSKDNNCLTKLDNVILNVISSYSRVECLYCKKLKSEII